MISFQIFGLDREDIHVYAYKKELYFTHSQIDPILSLFCMHKIGKEKSNAEKETGWTKGMTVE